METIEQKIAIPAGHVVADDYEDAITAIRTARWLAAQGQPRLSASHLRQARKAIERLFAQARA